MSIHRRDHRARRDKCIDKTFLIYRIYKKGGQIKWYQIKEEKEQK